MAQTKGERNDTVNYRQKVGLIAAQSSCDRSETVIVSAQSGAV